MQQYHDDQIQSSTFFSKNYSNITPKPNQYTKTQKPSLFFRFFLIPFPQVLTFVLGGCIQALQNTFSCIMARILQQPQTTMVKVNNIFDTQEATSLKSTIFTIDRLRSASSKSWPTCRFARYNDRDLKNTYFSHVVTTLKQFPITLWGQFDTTKNYLG